MNEIENQKSKIKNSPELWDAVWRNPPNADVHRYACAQEAHTIRWQRIEQRVHARFGGFARLNVIEIGAGAGTNAALMAARGANVTVLDYSPQALAQARDLFAANQAQGSFVQANALALPDAVREHFDLAMSFGLNEHFTGQERVEIFRAHYDALRPGGIAFISVPNAYNPPYRAFKWFAQATHKWKLGVEIPFTRAELLNITAQIGASDPEFFGDSFIESWQFVNPWRYLRKRIGPPPVPDAARLRPERGTPLDERWSYATVLVFQKHKDDT